MENLPFARGPQRGGAEGVRAGPARNDAIRDGRAIAASTRAPVVPMGVTMHRAQRAAGACRLYRSRQLRMPRVTGAGVEHGDPGRRCALAWSEVEAALAAEVGEPEGVRTIVFDLLVREPAGRVALRLDADPGEDATAIARIVAAQLGDRARPSIKSLAVDGLATRWFPDLASFEESAGEELAG